MVKSNFHTHTVYCDGKNTPEEMVQTAIEKGFTALGFSGHSYYELYGALTMSVQDQREYVREITALKEKYAGQIQIYCGIEQDLYSPEPEFAYDYIIGSVHNVLKDGEVVIIDLSAENQKKDVDTIYGGDFDAYAEDYFEAVSHVLEGTKADIIGHIDLVSKYSEINGYQQSPRFLVAAQRAVEKLIPYGKPFEINTGAMARSGRTVPYPTKEILTMIREKGGKIVISSDCHNKIYLDHAFDTAVELAKECGFTEHGVLTPNGMQYIPL